MDNDKKELSTGEKIIEILSKIDKEHPTDKDLKSIQTHISEKEDGFLSLQKLSRNLITNQISRTFTTSEELREQLDLGADELRKELGYTTASTIEQLLIDEIILEFLRKYQMQLWLTTLTAGTKTEIRISKRSANWPTTRKNGLIMPFKC